LACQFGERDDFSIVGEPWQKRAVFELRVHHVF
jgi:hypothetical protein